MWSGPKLQIRFSPMLGFKAEPNFWSARARVVEAASSTRTRKQALSFQLRVWLHARPGLWASVQESVSETPAGPKLDRLKLQFSTIENISLVQRKYFYFLFFFNALSAINSHLHGHCISDCLQGDDQPYGRQALSLTSSQIVFCFFYLFIFY